MKYSVPRKWEGETCVILAGGPSLKTQDLSKLWKSALHVITINDSWRLLPRLKIPHFVSYFCDQQWWSTQIAKNSRSLDNLIGFHDMIYRGFWVNGSRNLDFLDHPQVRSLKFTGERGLETDPTGLRHGSNSGYQAINLAVHLGAKKIILLGYDMKIVNGRSHWHNDSHLSNNEFQQTLEKTMLPHFPSLITPLNELGIEVINATPDSALKCFPMMTLTEALEEPVGEY